MSTVIFVDILAYSGSALGVLLLSAAGIILLRPGGAVACLSMLITDERARQCVRDGVFTSSRARAAGTLFLLLACFMGVCIVRGMVHL